jgi:hypothetical protein
MFSELSTEIILMIVTEMSDTGSISRLARTSRRFSAIAGDYLFKRAVREQDDRLLKTAVLSDNRYIILRAMEFGPDLNETFTTSTMELITHGLAPENKAVKGVTTPLGLAARMENHDMVDFLRA